MSVNIYPECRTKQTRNVIRHGNMNWVPLYCANCGGDGGIVPEEGCDFAFYLCMDCAETMGPIDGVYMEPDHVWWEKMCQEQDNPLALEKLIKDQPHFDKVKMS